MSYASIASWRNNLSTTRMHALDCSRLFWNTSQKKETTYSPFLPNDQDPQGPLKMTPIVSCSATLLFPLKVWVDCHLQTVACQLLSHFPSSQVLKSELIQLHLPPNTRFLKSNTRSLYIKIQTGTVLHLITAYFRHSYQKLGVCPSKY